MALLCAPLAHRPFGSPLPGKGDERLLLAIHYSLVGRVLAPTDKHTQGLGLQSFELLCHLGDQVVSSAAIFSCKELCSLTLLACLTWDGCWTFS